MPFNNLTPAEAERLDWLAEECAEVIQAISKIKRHGFESCHPKDGPVNRRSLEKELGQASLAIDLMLERGDIEQEGIDRGHHEKSMEIDRWLHHNSLNAYDEEGD